MNFLETEGKIFLENEHKNEISWIKYELKNDTFYATSTVVDPILRGQGIAYKLVEALANKARNEGKLIFPICPYVVELFKKVDTFSDVWKK